MKIIETEITINTNVSAVWEALTDFSSYHKWNPFITYIEGEQKVGAELLISVLPPNRKGMTFKPTLLKFEKDTELCWKGKLLFTGLFDGEHYFKLIPLNATQTRLIHGERFSGILLGLLSAVLKDTEKGFIQMNLALKEKCEHTL